jgi:hypothetical protein
MERDDPIQTVEAVSDHGVNNSYAALHTINAPAIRRRAIKLDSIASKRW